MNSAIIGLFGIYLILVGWNGNAETFFAMLADEKGFVPWVVVLLVLGALSSYSGTHEFVAPFLFLAVVAVMVTRADQLKVQASNAYKFLTE